MTTAGQARMVQGISFTWQGRFMATWTVPGISGATATPIN